MLNINHHICHLASAFYVSPFEKSVVVSVDGFGDFSSGCMAVGHGSEIEVKDSVLFPHSLGLFYETFTQFLGFPNFGDEYKVMGLAPYGKPTFVEELRDVVKTSKKGRYRLNLKYFRHHNEDLKPNWSGGTPTIGCLYKEEAVSALLGFGPRTSSDSLEQHHIDLAHSVQVIYEEAFFALLNAAYDLHPIDNLTLAGGCGNNSVANGKIYRNTKFKNVYIAASAGDAGGAIGAAFHAAKQTSRDFERFEMAHAYWGPQFNRHDIEKLLHDRSADLAKDNCEIKLYQKFEELSETVAGYLTEAKVVGWFQGRMEWGPRALGNRSILGDPRRDDMKDILNLKIKRRESFRPFAPSILEEAVSDWFEEVDDVPFMMQVFQFELNKRAEVPAVCHVDGSGRLQTVSKATNPRYHALITNFYKKTGVPMVLNTSFNENEPVVCRPEEALDCFLRTKMDVVVLGDYVIRRGG